MTDSNASPLRHLDIQTVSELARAESRNREVYLPPVSVYRWWARRTGAVNGAVLDAVGQDRTGSLLVSDPFAGGGVIPLVATSKGHRVYAQELDPWAVLGLEAMLSLPEPGRLTEALEKLQIEVADELERAYGTTMADGRDGYLSHTFRVAVASCGECGNRQRLFPHALVSLLRRKESGPTRAYLACPQGHLFVGTRVGVQSCPICATATDPAATYTRGRLVTCFACHHIESLADRAGSGPWDWEVVLVERAEGRTRELAIAGRADVNQAEDERWRRGRELGAILDGQETAVLLRHGFRDWSDLYPRRQHAIVERLLLATSEMGLPSEVATAMTMAILGTTEMAGYASRWDRYYLKSYESMAAHRFNLTTFAAEPNVWGTEASGRGTLSRRVRLFEKASRWQADSGAKLRLQGPLLSTARRRPLPKQTQVRIVIGSSERQVLPNGGVDLVLTDPPYHDDVQYGELSAPLRAWAQLCHRPQAGDAVANARTQQNHQLETYGALLERIFSESRRTLAANGHIIFSYANRQPDVWLTLFRSLHAAGLRACGWAIVHSENETDHAKRAVRACTMDMVLDLVPSSEAVPNIWRPPSVPTTPEGQFLGLVGLGFERVGDPSVEWNDEFRDALNSAAFLTRAEDAAV